MPAEAFDFVVLGGLCVTERGIQRTDIGIKDGKIAAIGDLNASQGDSVLEAHGLHVLPGAIDPQVHFREPGFPAKEDLDSGTKAAILGGITAICEMPNTNPSTTTAEAINDKLARAKGRAHCDYAFFVGATSENAEQLVDLERLPGCCGVKIFMGSSTGNLLVADDETLARVLASGSRRVAVHSEDEDRLIARQHLAKEAANVHAHPVWRDAETARLATERFLRLATAAGRRAHLLHVTTEEEIPLIEAASDLVTWEIPPQHLTFAAPEIYDRIGTRAQMNPPIREQRHQDALWKAIDRGTVHAVASDHAPHTLEEKAKPYPSSPAGMPGVQTILPLMCHHHLEGRLSLERVVELTSLGPAEVWSMKGKGPIAIGRDADLSVMDLSAQHVVKDSEIVSNCGWTPFAGMTFKAWPVATVIRGRMVMRDGEVLGAATGQPLTFTDVD